MVALPNEHTVVMGGLINEETTLTESKVPLLGDIPGLGYLFKSKNRRKIKRNLFIFVTPHILRQRGGSFDELHRQSWSAKMKADERIQAFLATDPPVVQPPIPLGFTPLNIVVSPDGKKVYASSQFGNQVAIVTFKEE